MAELLQVVVNPRAGQGRWFRIRQELSDLLAGAGFAPQFQLSESAEHLAELVRLAAGPLALVGGDGTLHAALPALLASGRPVALIPAGTGNDYAAALGLRSLRAAVARLSDPLGSSDVLRTSLGPCANGLSLGLDAEVARFSAEAPDRLRGPARYLYGLARAYANYRPLSLEVWADGRLRHCGPAALVAVMNGPRYGGGFRIAPPAQLSDGWLDLVLGRDLTRSELLGLIAKLLAGRHLRDPRVLHLRARSLEIRSREPLVAQIDGELAEPARCWSADLLPAGLALLGGSLAAPDRQRRGLR